MKRNRVFAIVGIIAFATSGVVAQESRSEIGLEGIGFFMQNASGEGSLPARYEHRRRVGSLP
jgi:hypothetical protein